MTNTPEKSPVEANPEKGKSRTISMMVTLLLFLLGLLSPFLYVAGMNTASGAFRFVGFTGTLIAASGLIVLPVLRKRLGFTFYDWIAILIALLFSLSQSPGFIRS